MELFYNLLELDSSCIGSLSKMVTSKLVEEHWLILWYAARLRPVNGKHDWKNVVQVLKFFEIDVLRHKEKEERVLFPAIFVVSDDDKARDLLRRLHKEHQLEHTYLKEIRGYLQRRDWPRMNTIIDKFIGQLTEHIIIENNVLFPYGEQILSPDARQRVSYQMSRIGYLV